MLLADVFEKFIDTCLTFYTLDPCHYFSSPGLSWAGMLIILVWNFRHWHVYLFVEEGLRGGISCSAKR